MSAGFLPATEINVERQHRGQSPLLTWGAAAFIGTVIGMSHRCAVGENMCLLGVAESESM